MLTGTRDDGSAGLAVIKASGGATIVQDPKEAMYAGMPASAIANVAVDAIVPSELVASTIAAMVKGEDPPPGAASDDPDPNPPDGEPVNAVCPECGGVLTERAEAGVLQWECRVGHRYSPDALIDAQADNVEGALSAAVRVLADRAALLGRMAQNGRSARTTSVGTAVPPPVAIGSATRLKSCARRSRGQRAQGCSGCPDTDEEDHVADEDGAA